MNKNNNLSKSVPDTQDSFQIDIIGDITKKRFLGEFTSKIPTIKDQCLIDKHEVLLNGPYPEHLKDGIKRIHKMIAYLRYTLIEPFPKFWIDSDRGYELRDSNVIDAVYTEVLALEQKWADEMWAIEPEMKDESKRDEEKV